jgi:hypothetical protein
MLGEFWGKDSSHSWANFGLKCKDSSHSWEKFLEKFTEIIQMKLHGIFSMIG